MMLTVYVYEKCDSCRKAVKWLEARRIPFKTVPIRDQPPSQRELQAMLKSLDGDLGKLFNRSGSDYREMKLKDKLPEMTPADAIKLLSENGNLIKRPFALTRKGGLVGFEATEWADKLG
jgi:arsenate reductase (glutaredoxin)